jgi:hypothetical protein
MKKKIIYGLLLAVAMVTATSSFVSCKDYEGDDLAAIRERIAIDGINSQATLDELIKTQLSLSQAQLESLIEAINNLKADDPMKQTAGSQADGYQNQLAQLQQDYQNASTIAEKVAILNRLTQLLASLNGTAGATPGTVAVPSATEVIIAMWGDSLYNAYHWADSAYRRAQILSDSIKNTLKIANQADALSKENKYRLDTLSLRAYKLFNDAKTYTDQATLNMYNNIMNQLLAKMTKDSLAIYNKIAQESGAIYGKMTQDSAAIYAKMKADSTTLANVIKAAEAQLTKDRKADSTLFENKLAAIDLARKNDSTKFEKLIHELDSTMKAEDAKLDKKFTDAMAKLDSTMKAEDALLAEKIAKIDSAYQAGDSLLNVRCNDIEKGYKDAVKDLQGQLDKLSDKVKDIEENLTNVQGTLKKLISGVIVQGTYSPVFGYGSLPLGIQTNILAAYAGKSTVQNEYEFPAYGKANTAANKAIITGEDYDFVESLGQWPATVTIPANEILVDETEGNAGVMFLTVNPTNVDFSGTDFSLVNSAGEKSRIQLSNLDACSDVMTFGWTRGASVASESMTGFYSAKATITKDNVENMQPRFDKAGFKNAVKEAVNGQKRMAVKDLARALYNSLEPVDRFGVRALWSDPTVGTRTVTSAFDIAAFSVEPLGFGFRIPESVKIPTIPTLNKQTIADSLHINLTVDPIVITAQDKVTGKYVILVEIPEMVLDPNKVLIMNDGEVVTEVGSQSGMYYFVNGNYLKLYGGSYYNSSLSELYPDLWLANYELRKGYAYIDFTPMFEALFGEFNTAFANLNDASASINKKIDRIATIINSYIDKANGYINRANSVLANLSNAIQPVLIWSDGTNAGELGGFVSGTYAAGTTVKAGSDLALIATSYSLELLAPAYKKSLIVTNAYKGGNTAHTNNELKQAVKALNADIQAQGFDVFSGQSLKNPYIFNSDKVGVTYEIAYTAVDYEGKIAGRKFYVTVVE